MPDESQARSQRPTSGHGRTAAILYRIAGCVFALTGILNAFTAYWSDTPTSHISLAVTNFSLCVVFIALGEVQARKARQEKEGAGDSPAKQ